MRLVHPTISKVFARTVLMLSGLSVLAGCHDGPLFALKKANPYYSMHQWPAAEKLGPTDYKRAEELRLLVDSVEGMSATEQRRWMTELDKLMEHDASPHMRGMAVQAAGKSSVAEALAIIESGLEDDDTKVRMIAARSLQKRTEPEATRLLVKTVNSEANKDVRLTAIRSLGAHRGPEVTDTLRSTLDEQDLAYRHTTIASLRQVTGKDAGDNADAWIAMLDSGAITSNGEEQPTGWGAKLKSFF